MADRWFLFTDSRVANGRGWKLVVNATSAKDARDYVRATSGSCMKSHGEMSAGELENLAKSGATAAVTPEREAQIHSSFVEWIDKDLSADYYPKI